jgi:hypothetical protein
MKPLEKYFPIFQTTLENYENKHPHWHTEVFVSIVKWAVQSLKHYIEDDQESQVSWDNPFVELHYPIGWNWKTRGREDDLSPGGHIFGRITSRNTATPELARKTLAQIMANQHYATVLANATNWVWYEKLRNRYTQALPIHLMAELYTIEEKQKRHECFDKWIRPFSIGVTRISSYKARRGSRKGSPSMPTNRF